MTEEEKQLEILRQSQVMLNKTTKEVKEKRKEGKITASDNLLETTLIDFNQEIHKKYFINEKWENFMHHNKEIKNNLLITSDIEPCMNFRWIMNFSSDLKIEPYIFSSVILPSIKNSFFGKKYSNLILTLRDLREKDFITNEFIFNNIENFKNKNFVLEMLDPTGEKIYSYIIKVKKLKKIYFKPLQYNNKENINKWGNGDINEVRLEFSVENVSFSI